MDDSHNCHTEGLAFRSFFKEIFCKNMISFYDRESHDVENSSKTSIASFGYPSSNFGLAGFIDRRVEAGIGDEFFMRGEEFIFDFGQEMRGCDIADAGEGFEDMHLSRCFLLTGLDEEFSGFFQLVL